MLKPRMERSHIAVHYLIDKEGILRHQVVNDLPLGRNIDEMIWMIDASQFNETHGEICPAGWKEGDAGMKGIPRRCCGLSGRACGRPVIQKNGKGRFSKIGPSLSCKVWFFLPSHSMYNADSIKQQNST